MSYLKMVMHINVIAQVKKQKNKKKDQDKKKFPIFMIENGGIKVKMMHPKILNLL